MTIQYKYMMRRRMMMNMGIPDFFSFKRIPVDVVLPSLGWSGNFPAFTVDGQLYNNIHIGQYEASNASSTVAPTTIKGVIPQTSISFNNALTSCALLGSGYHLMTLQEWAAVAWFCVYNNTIPTGNTTGSSGSMEPTGSGTVSRSHNNEANGIYDLCGNASEWVGGVRLVKGELQVLQNNNAANNTNSQAANSGLWKAYNASSHTLQDPSGNGRTANCLRLTWVSNSSFSPGGGYWMWTTDTTINEGSQFCYFSQVKCSSALESDTTTKRWLQLRGLLPIGGIGENYGNDMFRANNSSSEVMCQKGGSFNNSSYAGIFAIGFTESRTSTGTRNGFRVAHYGSV